MKYLIPLLLSVKKVWKIFSSKKTNQKIWEQKRNKIGSRSQSVFLKNLVMWNQNDNSFLN